MAYRLKVNERLETGIRRILQEQGQRAEAHLTGAADQVAGVHDARKCIKRMRALLRLVRPVIGDVCWREHNAALREAGQALSGIRDRDVLRQTVQTLAADAKAPLRKALSALADRLGGSAADPEATAERAHQLKQTAEVLAAMQARFEDLEVPGDVASGILHGLEQGHARIRKSLARVREGDDPEALHELRKSIQAHWRHMLVLSPAWPEAMKARAAEARAISNQLGQDRDLALLEAHVVAEADAGRAPGATVIRRAIEARRKAIALEALPRVERLVVGKASRFAREVGDLWAIARRLSRPERRGRVVKTEE